MGNGSAMVCTPRGSVAELDIEYSLRFVNVFAETNGVGSNPIYIHHTY